MTKPTYVGDEAKLEQIAEAQKRLRYEVGKARKAAFSGKTQKEFEINQAWAIHNGYLPGRT